MDSSNDDKKKLRCTEAQVINFVEARIRKIREAYQSGDIDLKERIDRLVSSERAMERLMQDMNMNEANRKRIRELRKKFDEEETL